LYDRGLALTTWSTLAGGLLTGKYLEEIPAGSRFATDQFKESRNALFNTPDGKVKLEKVKKLKEVMILFIYFIYLCFFFLCFHFIYFSFYFIFRLLINFKFHWHN